ncbi:DUF5658 family protein [Sporosarcina sp. 179-K 3D1 HS]|uniref:DUF5658 family protein n=1 Tax=Sporosarcina sp. 179-K 3D1 HS TaxID=3232169 RepID=UPI0039A12D22
MGADYSLLFTRDHMRKAALLLIALAIFDCLSTDIGIRHAHIEEANPLMRFLYDHHIAYFYGIKIGLPLILLLLLKSIEPKRLLAFFLGSALFLYLMVFGLHVFWIAHL